MSISKDNKNEDKFPLPSDSESKVEMIDFFMQTYQRARFRRLTSMVSHLFEKEGRKTVLSNAIIKFLHLTSPGTICDIFSQVPDVPFDQADKEVQGILRKEFNE